MRIVNVDRLTDKMEEELRELENRYAEMPGETPEEKRSASRIHGRIKGMRYVLDHMRASSVEITV
jgi:hypothetical protein